MLYYVGKKTILELTLDRFKSSRVKTVMLVINEADRDAVGAIAERYEDVAITVGGETRTESVRRGLKEIGHCDVVCIHDGARPYVTAKIIDDTIESAVEYGSGIAAVPTVDTVSEINDGEIIRHLAKSGLYNVQTPQTFIFDQIQHAYNLVQGNFSDDSEVYALAGFKPHIVLGEYENIKLTHAYELFAPASGRTKIGLGFDVHRLVSGRDLILGGVMIPHNKGLLGHSDADCLVHAVMDALLSAAELPDIGVLFPETDPKYKGASSIRLLAEIYGLITRRSYAVGNVSAVIMAEKPRMRPYIPDMIVNISTALNTSPDRVNISATTTERLGLIGDERGIAASATCLLFY
jgi:2-C-methyl-D-erythritol 2,4-cyclodiphosphate synthase/2-C-methyl-D-erythritol 4-phosphate cytidylyltransferase